MEIRRERRQSIVKRVLLILALAVSVAPIAAQTIRGALTGTVTDSTGALVPGAA